MEQLNKMESVQSEPVDVEYIDVEEKINPFQISKKDIQEQEAEDSFTYDNANSENSEGFESKDGPDHEDTGICKCQYQCKQLSETEKSLLEMQHIQTPQDQQSRYVMSLINISPISRRRHGSFTEASESRRQNTVCYNIPAPSGEVYRVCSKTFREIFHLSPRKLQTFLKKKKKGYDTYIDERIKSSPKEMIVSSSRKKIREHITSFPREESNCGRNSNLEFLSPDLNLHRMFKAFKEKYPDNSFSYKTYKDILEIDFPNLSFMKTSSASCHLCDSHNSSTKFPPENIEFHQGDAELISDLMKNDFAASQARAGDTCTVHIDSPYVICLPTPTDNRMLYFRQLCNYNVCIHTDFGNSYVCMWHEGIAGQGINEIASCFWKLMNVGFSKKKKLRIWLDNEKKSDIQIILMLILFVIAKGKFASVELKFHVTGHEYQHYDNDFSVVEKKRQARKLMVPEELEEVVRTVRKRKPYEVIHMQKEDFYDFSAEANAFLDISEIEFSKVSWLLITSEHPHKVQIRTSFSEIQNWSEFSIIKKGCDIDSLPQCEKITPLSSCKGISEEKKKDLLSVCDFLDKKCKDFYESLCK